MQERAGGARSRGYVGTSLGVTRSQEERSKKEGRSSEASPATIKNVLVWRRKRAEKEEDE